MVEEKLKLTDEEASCTFRKMTEAFFHELDTNSKFCSECVRLYGDLPFIKRVLKELNPRQALELYYTINSGKEDNVKGMTKLLNSVLEIMRD